MLKKTFCWMLTQTLVHWSEEPGRSRVKMVKSASVVPCWKGGRWTGQ